MHMYVIKYKANEGVVVVVVFIISEVRVASISTADRHDVK